MKMFLAVIMLSYTLMASNAQEEATKLGVESDYALAISKAKKEKKILVMVIVKKNCRWCKKLINQTLSEESVKKRLKSFITVIVDKDAKFPSTFTENFFPSVFYIDSSTEKSVYSNVGYVGTKCFLNDLNSSEEILESLYTDKD